MLAPPEGSVVQITDRTSTDSLGFREFLRYGFPWNLDAVPYEYLPDEERENFVLDLARLALAISDATSRAEVGRRRKNTGGDRRPSARADRTLPASTGRRLRSRVVHQAARSGPRRSAGTPHVSAAGSGRQPASRCGTRPRRRDIRPAASARTSARCRADRRLPRSVGRRSVPNPPRVGRALPLMRQVPSTPPTSGSHRNDATPAG